jgi:hypothetical protein
MCLFSCLITVQIFYIKERGVCFALGGCHRHWGRGRVGLQFDTPAPPLLPPSWWVGGVRCDQNARHSRPAPASGAISDTCDTRPAFPAAPPAALFLGASGITGRATLRKYPFRQLNALARMDAHSFTTDLRRDPPD